MKKLAVVLGMMAAVGCSAGGGPKNGDISVSKRIPLHVAVDTKGVPLGAYQVVIQFHPDEAHVAEIYATHGSDFRGRGPNFDPAMFAKGAVRVTGYSLRTTRPAGPYELLTVWFERVGMPRSPVSVRVERLYDTQRPPREITSHDVIVDRTTLDFNAK